MVAYLAVVAPVKQRQDPCVGGSAYLIWPVPGQYKLLCHKDYMDVTSGMIPHVHFWLAHVHTCTCMHIHKQLYTHEHIKKKRARKSRTLAILHIPAPNIKSQQPGTSLPFSMVPVWASRNVALADQFSFFPEPNKCFLSVYICSA